MIIVDSGFFLFLALLFGSVIRAENGTTRIWDLVVGFLFLIIEKVSFDLHRLPQTYKQVMTKFHNLWL